MKALKIIGCAGIMGITALSCLSYLIPIDRAHARTPQANSVGKLVHRISYSLANDTEYTVTSVGNKWAQKKHGHAEESSSYWSESAIPQSGYKWRSHSASQNSVVGMVGYAKDAPNPWARSSFSEQARNPWARSSFSEQARNPWARSSFSEQARNPWARSSFSEQARNPWARSSFSEQARNPWARSSFSEQARNPWARSTFSEQARNPWARS
jgi:hypothetical protein